MNINAAFVGCGEIAKEHLEALQELEGLSVQAYCDIHVSRAQALLNSYGGHYATNDIAKVLSDDNIDAIYICTHHDSHTSIALQACEASKHVMMEKPLALTLDDCHTIAEAVEQSGIIMMTAFKFRYYKLVQKAKAFIPSPLLVTGQIMDRRWPDDFWAQDPVKGGGNILSQGVHAMDLLCWFNGSKPKQIYAEGGALTHPGAEVLDSIVVTIRFQNGGIASLAQADGGETPYLGKFTYHLIDGQKSVHLHNRLKQGHFYNGKDTTVVSEPKESGMVEENREFIRALQTKTKPFTTVEDGIRASAMALTAVEAARTGQVLKVDW